MLLEKTVCPYCGAPLTVDPSMRTAKCEYCDMTSLIRTQAKPSGAVPAPDAEEQGYRFEKGRQRAQAEQPAVRYVQRTVVRAAPEQPKKKHVFWWIMGFLFIYPLPATILVSRNKKMHWLIKGLLYVLLWGSYLALAVASQKNA